MNERTLEQALQRAESLRRYRTVNSAAFERNEDHQDIVLLADEIERLRLCPQCGCDHASAYELGRSDERQLISRHRRV